MKREEMTLAEAAARAFPPRSCGGLIEASTTRQTDTALQRFPPAFVRGPH